MKWMVWLLLLLNALLLAYFNLSAAPVSSPSLSHLPIDPEKIKLLTPQEIAALPQRPVEAAEVQPIAPVPVKYGCYEWGSFSIASLPRARNIITKFSLNATVEQQTLQEATRYWVYIPQSKSLQEAQAVLDDLHSKGINESFIVMEPQWRYAISLGVFKDEQLAAKLLEELKTKGVSSAVKGLRNHEKGQASLLINNMSSDMASEIDRLKPDFPGSELKEVACQ